VGLENDSEGHTLKVNKDQQLLFMLQFHYMRLKVSLYNSMTNRVNTSEVLSYSSSFTYKAVI
jgi:hypothetical protein